MASNNIRFNVGYDIDTSTLNKLKTSLSELQKMTASDYMSLHKGMDLEQAKAELIEVKKSVNDVQLALKNSFNTNLGTTNVTKLSQELKTLGLEKIANNFNAMGAKGQNAFRSLTSEVLTTKLQLKETHKLLDSMATSMSNTIKWGITSSIMNSFTGSVQKAYGYVKNLDESLTNIRIVSGQNADQMAKFAKEANTAAQALGATTLEYTDAALIYYQQGLSSEDVAARTNATIKMANVLGESADQVSDYMTAIWNNFKSGSLTMEEYGDIITALGAKTAASSEEIATGLEKFASVAEASGLSYEYATSALATVVATTRQSADTVGTAFKTIFARIQGLNLGETLDDGTTLNKYSEALNKVGISIKDQNGELKQMDTILDEMGAKWSVLNKDQRLALAQTVAGTRQYNQLVALMDNWDFMTENLETAAEATGTLDEQQSIYMDSMEAHLNQLKTAQQDLYDSLFDSDSFKDLIDIFTALTNGLGTFVDGIGGGGTALLSLGSIAMNVFNRQIAQGLATTINNFRASSENAKQLTAQMQILDEYKQFNLGDAGVQQLVDMKKQVLDLGSLLTQEQQNEANAIIQETADLQNQKNEWEEKLKLARDYVAELDDIEDISTFKGIGDGSDFEKVSSALEEVSLNSKKTSTDIKIYQKQLNETRKATLNANNATENRIELEEQAVQAERDLKSALESVALEMKLVSQANGATEQQQEELTKAVNDYKAAIASGADPSEAGQALLDTYERVNDAIRQSAEETLNIVQQESQGASEEIENGIAQADGRWQRFVESFKTQQLAQRFTKLVAGIGQVTAGIQSLVNITKIWNNEDLTAGEKVLQIISALVSAIPMLITGVGAMIVGLTGMTAAEFAAQVAAVGLGTALWTALAPILPIILAIVGAVAGIAAIGAVIYAVVKAFNADAEAAKEAAEQAKVLTDRYNELNEAATKLKETISDYSDAKNALKDLTVGTEEYKKALEEANAKAKELIETYGLYDSWHMEDGLITFDPGVLEQAQREAEQAAEKARSNMAAANISSNQANIRSKTTNLRRQANLSTIEQGRRVNLGNDDIQRISELMNEWKNQNNGVELGDKQLKDKLESLGGAFAENADKIVSFRDDFESLADSMSDAQKANEYYAKQVIGVAITDNYGDRITKMATDEEGNTNDALVAQITAAATEVAAKQEAENEANLQKRLEGVKGTASSNDDLVNKLNELGIDYGLTKSNNDDDDLAMAYAKYVLGYENTEDFTHEDGWNKGTVRDETGKVIIDNVSDDVMRHALHRQAQIDQITAEFEESIGGESGKGLIDALEKMQKGADEFGDTFNADFTGAILNGMASGDFTKLDFSSLFGEIDPSEYAQLLGMDQKTLLEQLGLTEDDIKALGYKDAAAFYTAWQQGISEYDPLDYWNAQLDKSNKNIDTVSVAINAFSSGDELDDDQLKAVEELKETYSDLFDGAVEGSHEYIEALRQVREQEESNKMEALEGIKQEAVAKKEALEQEIRDLKDRQEDAAMRGSGGEVKAIQVQIDAKREEFDEIIDEIQEADYSIKMQIEADLASDVENAFGLAEEFDAITAKIKENFQVTAEEAQELIAAGYGAMLQNAQPTADGLIQLNDAVVNSFIDGKQAELEADKEAKIAELQNQREMLVTQLNTLQAKQQALSSARQATTMGDKKMYLAQAMMIQAEYEAEVAAMNGELEAQDQANQQMTEGAEQMYSVLSGMYDTDSQNEQNAIDAADGTAAKHGQQTVQYYNNMQEAVAAYAQAVANAENGVASYNPVAWHAGSGGTGTISTGQTAIDNSYQSVYSAIEKTVDDITAGLEDSAAMAQVDEVIAQLEADTQSQIDTLNGQIGAIDAGIAALQTSYTTLDKVQSNRGSKDNSGKDKKEKDPDHIDYLENEADLYHDIDIEIKNIERDLSRLQNQQDRLSGKDLIKNLNEQLKILEKQRDAYAEKIEIAKIEAANLRMGLGQSGVNFNSDGTIANYAAALEAKKQYVNNLIAQYNNMSAEEQEAFKQTIEDAKKEYSEFEKQISEYDKLITDTIPGLQDSIEDALVQEIEIQVQKFNMDFEITLDLTEATKQWNEFKRRIIDGIDDDDNLLGGVNEIFANMGLYYDRNNTGQIQKETSRLNEIKEQLDILNTGGHSDIYSAYDADTGMWVDNKAQAMEDLKTTLDQLMSDMSEYEDMIDSVNDAFLNSIDNVADAYDKQKESVEFFNKQNEHNLKMVQLLYGDKAYDKMAKYYDKQVEGSEEQIKNLKQQQDYWYNLMIAARDAGDMDAYEKYKDNWTSTIEDLNSEVEQWADNITAQYENTINKIMEELKDKMSNGLGMDYIGEELDLLNDNAELYLDTINRTYEIQSLSRKWQDSINNTNSISAQRKLNDLMEKQMTMLREKDKLSQYDIERAEMEYQIALKQIALEEAQQNKSSMRLRRDANGNYSYQFVADEDSIANAQQELDDARNELYNFDKTAYQNNLNEMYAAIEEYQEKVRDLYLDMDLSDEERLQKKQLLDEQYGERINALTEQNLTIRSNLQNSAFQELANMYGTDVSNFQNMSDEEKDIIMNSIVPQWDSGVQLMIDKISAEGGLVPVCEGAFNQLKEALDNYKLQLEEVGEVSDSVSEQVYTQQEALEQEAQAAIDAAEAERYAIEEVRTQVQGLIEDYKTAKAEAIAAAQAAYAFWQQEQKLAQEKSKNNSGSGGNGGGSSGSNGNTGSGNSNSGGGNNQNNATPNNSDKAEGVAAAIWIYGGASGWGNDPERAKKLKEKGVTAAQSIINSQGPSGQLYKKYYGKNLSSYYYGAFEKGGYTGDWDGSDGKPFLLHPKELVLNKDDTEKIFNIVDMVRQLEEKMSNNMLSQYIGLIDKLASSTNLMQQQSFNNDEAIEQNVHIDATFTDATTSSEIENALSNLVNKASQYANRTTR